MIYAIAAIVVWTLALNHAASGVHALKHGLGWLTSGRAEADRPDASELEGRVARAHRNHLENVVVFLPLCVLVMHLGQGGSAVAVGLAWAFLGARLGHLIFYAAGIAPLRSLSHTVNLAAHAGMGLVALGVLG